MRLFCAALPRDWFPFILLLWPIPCKSGNDSLESAKIALSLGRLRRTLSEGDFDSEQALANKTQLHPQRSSTASIIATVDLQDPISLAAFHISIISQQAGQPDR
jgi:hypothetical protein